VLVICNSPAVFLVGIGPLMCLYARAAHVAVTRVTLHRTGVRQVTEVAPIPRIGRDVPRGRAGRASGGVSASVKARPRQRRRYAHQQGRAGIRAARFRGGQGACDGMVARRRARSRATEGKSASPPIE